MIQRELFYVLLPQGVKVGDYRIYNITKSEPILSGDSVIYDHFQTISESLSYDFQQEVTFDYVRLSKEDIVNHVKTFISGIWQFPHLVRKIHEQLRYL